MSTFFFWNESFFFFFFFCHMEMVIVMEDRADLVQ